MYACWRPLPAFSSLGLPAHKLLVDLLMAYRPDSHNAFDLSDAYAASLLGVCPNTARKAVMQLVERGWIQIEREGGLKGPRSNRVRIVSLSCYATEVRDAKPERYERWKEPGVTKPKLRPVLRPYSGDC